MVKEDSLSDDLNFVKEFEELKLKQKLLIDSLNRKNKTEMNEFLVDINSKLDFLVKIFKETQDISSNEDDKNILDEKIDTILDNINNKFSLLEEKIDSKFLNLEDQISIIKVNISKNQQNFEPLNESLDSNSLPSPNFKADLSNKIPDTLEKDEVIKKKKWF